MEQKTKKPKLTFSHLALLIAGASAVLVTTLGFFALRERRMMLNLTALAGSREEIQNTLDENFKIYSARVARALQDLNAIRPHTEEEIITFLERHEMIEKKLLIDAQIRSLAQPTNIEKPKDALKRLYYETTFFGTFTQLTEYLDLLEALPYYIHVLRIEYRTPSQDVEKLSPNITIFFALYNR